MSDLESAQLIAIERGDRLIKANDEIIRLLEINVDLREALKRAQTALEEASKIFERAQLDHTPLTGTAKIMWAHSRDCADAIAKAEGK